MLFSPDSRLFAYATGATGDDIPGSEFGLIRLLDVATQQILGEPLNHSSYVSSLAFSPDGITLASGSYDKTIKLWSIGIDS